ncbi:hypothetical protein FGU46_10420 [Methanobacterium sp. CWC-01]|uniref:hypothetical protein n=1 Tax=Methanobacterium aridiramus TaxID=2584467 RepID=UPI002579050B|nr:hypothetical protein [Methanobacterium sp. CWC-01]MCE5214789.1 hypothetical protein [Methanobacterium sp.]WJI10473.1 hypothetical protein FGU46_10420 [Methanobacterium sp. CWC-01]
MPVFILDMEHSPEMCPMYNDKIRKKFKEQYNKMKEIAAKLEIKILINLSVAMDHTSLLILEAPSVESMENFVMEMGLVSFQTITMRHAINTDEVIERF